MVAIAQDKKKKTRRGRLRFKWINRNLPWRKSSRKAK